MLHAYDDPTTHVCFVDCFVEAANVGVAVVGVFALGIGVMDKDGKPVPRTARLARSCVLQHLRVAVGVAESHNRAPANEAVDTDRLADWKATYLENRANQLDVWREPFVHLRLPLLFNLRRDPFEKSQQNSNTYHDWMIERAFALVPLQAVASKFLMTMKEYPPSQTPGDWSLDTLEKQFKQMTTAGE
jgi:hypothetical protein